MRIRQIEIENFRSIQSLLWYPDAGLNCIVGPGDSGKSTILDAIEICLGGRRHQFFDTDFFKLNTALKISIKITLGELPENFKSLEAYGNFLRGYDPVAKKIEDEPSATLENVLTVHLLVDEEMEPIIKLYSERTSQDTNLRWVTAKERAAISASRIGEHSDHNLSWRKGSVLSRVSKSTPEVALELRKAARQTREAFGESAAEQLADAINTVNQTAESLGIPVGESVKALLDSHSISLSGGVVALHDFDGVPLSELGNGSARLLSAGLQKFAAERAQGAVLLVDELEYGLEPHRIIRLLNALGAKSLTSPPMQVFLTTHSPVVLRELSSAQISVIRKLTQIHSILQVGCSDEIQSTVRSCPEALLAPKIIVCEGATEVGFLRGLDHCKDISINASGVVLVDGAGVDNMYKRAKALQSLGYLVATVRDDDKRPLKADEDAFRKDNGTIFHWESGMATEDMIFAYLHDEDLTKAIEVAVRLHGREIIDQHLSSASYGKIKVDSLVAPFTADTRKVISRVANKCKWYKSVGHMEELAHSVLAAGLYQANSAFRSKVEEIFAWAHAE